MQIMVPEPCALCFVLCSGASALTMAVRAAHRFMHGLATVTPSHSVCW
jgi:hypothetical protein